VTLDKRLIDRLTRYAAKITIESVDPADVVQSALSSVMTYKNLKNVKISYLYTCVKHEAWRQNKGVTVQVLVDTHSHFFVDYEGHIDLKRALSELSLLYC